jgi:small subunit ribosomal protein S20
LAHTHSAKKRMRQDAKRRERNRSVTTHFRHRIRECRAAIASGDAQAAGAKLLAAARAIHRAAGKGVIHENTANRYISRLTRAVNALTAAKPSTPA